MTVTKPNDLEERTTNFAKQTMFLVQKVQLTILNKNIVSQLLRSSSSIGANYREARECESKNDFIHKLGIVKKETNETLYWLDLLKEADKNINVQNLVLEAGELLRIFSKSISTAKQNMHTKNY